MKEQALRELAAEYVTQRVANRDEERRRMDHAIRLDPEIGHLIDRRMDLFRRCTLAAFDAPDRAMDISKQLTIEFVSIAGCIKERLTAAGLDADYLQPVCRCPLCQDQGYVGEPIREMCDCLKQRLYQRLCRVGNLGINTEESFSAWDENVFDATPNERQPQGQRGTMLKLKAICLAYANNFPANEKPSMLFIGSSGVGKTYMLNCIAQRTLERGFTPWKLTASQMMSILRDAYFERGDAEQARLLRSSPLLMIDDLGTEPMQENITITQIFSLLNERGVRRQHTIVSTNLSPTDIRTRYSERIYSRLFSDKQMRVLSFRGLDVRRKHPTGGAWRELNEGAAT